MEKYTQEQFLLKANNYYNYKYDYSKSIYKGINKKLIITCKIHGDYIKSPQWHLRGEECPYCRKVNRNITQKEFIEKSNIIHNNKYNYDNVVYINKSTYVKINCQKHGEFLILPSRHLKKRGCQKCQIENQIVPSEIYINRLKKVHNNLYDYSKTIYEIADKPIIVICKIHGDFQIQAASHYKGQGCKKCFNEKRSFTQLDYISKAIQVHGNYYDYSKVLYNGNKKKIIVTCKLHGDFLIRAGSHTEGTGCRLCGLLNNSFSKSDWTKKGKNKLGIFYILRCFNSEESFFKLGITYKSIKRRYRGNLMPYNYEIIKTVKSNDLSYIWDLEKRFLRLKNKNKQHYKPKIKFPGSFKECFK